jgi:C4-dicarboxylate transporter
MALVTGSGDAATMAFNKSITPHAATFGYAQANLGMAAALAGTLGRSASPLAGAAIVCAASRASALVGTGLKARLAGHDGGDAHGRNVHALADCNG